ncbi:PepSY domain-containing protein [Thiospirillum jenense]|uniref:PepSY domain-containing protein n=1 Tax=Thiospirillum jenense TaxID=1653858 RepID=A0A839HDE2_9GAMM|nr:PepSY domain-containing protein [Thiospirillum jenense]MBB1126150.1 PepSY domain-containing protein [Thiospirillum jenense]
MQIKRLLNQLALVAIAPLALADPSWQGVKHHPRDHDHARFALERGEVRPLADILAQVTAAVPGEVVSVEFERQHHHGRGNWQYEIKVLAPNGRLREVCVDAASGRILTIEND